MRRRPSRTSFVGERPLPVRASERLGRAVVDFAFRLGLLGLRLERLAWRPCPECGALVPPDYRSRPFCGECKVYGGEHAR